MSSPPRPAVQRVRPPKGPYRVINKIMRWLLSRPKRAQRIGQHLLLLHLIGRRTGRQIVFPVAYRHADGGRLLVLTNSPWRVNLRGHPTVVITLLGEQRYARTELVEDPAAVAKIYHELIEEDGYARAGRRMGIRINVSRTPTHDELAEAARRDGLAAVYLDITAG